MRELALLSYQEFERDLEQQLTRFAVKDVVLRLQDADQFSPPPGFDEQKEIESLTTALTPKYGHWLAESPSLEDVTQISQDVAKRLAELGAIKDAVGGLELNQSPFDELTNGIEELFGAARKTLATELLHSIDDERMRLWRERVKQIDWELFDRGTEIFTWYALEEVVKDATDVWLAGRSAAPKEAERFAEQAVHAQLGKEVDAAVCRPFVVTPRGIGDSISRERVFLA